MEEGWRDEKESGGTGMDGGVKSGPERDKNDGRNKKKTTEPEMNGATALRPSWLLSFMIDGVFFLSPSRVPCLTIHCRVVLSDYSRILQMAMQWLRGGKKEGEGGEATFFFFLMFLPCCVTWKSLEIRFLFSKENLDKAAHRLQFLDK